MMQKGDQPTDFHLWSWVAVWPPLPYMDRLQSKQIECWWVSEENEIRQTIWNLNKKAQVDETCA